MSTELEFIKYSVEGGVAAVTLARPEKRNALSIPLLRELNAVLWDADANTSVHCVVISAEGPDFCAGYDLSPGVSDTHAKLLNGPYRDGGIYAAPGIDDDIWRIEHSQRLRMVLFDMHKPVIAQVQGRCLAGGMDVVLLCDMVIAAEDAEFGFPPARDLGSLPNQMWLYNCGPQWAKRLVLTGDTVSGRDAALIGLVLKAVPGACLREEVMGLAARLARIDPDLLTANKRIVNIGLELMGARTLQRMAAEMDGRAHQAKGTRQFRQIAKEQGLKAAFAARDSGFGDGRARVDRPDIRDEEGNLVGAGAAAPQP